MTAFRFRSLLAWLLAYAVVAMSAITPTAEAGDTRSLSVSSVGDGVITSTDGRIHCGTGCSADYPQGTVVTLRSSRGTDFVFRGWKAGCFGTWPSCSIVLDRDTTVQADFVRTSRTVNLTVGGHGSVVSEPSGIRCDLFLEDCSGSFKQGEPITLVPRPYGEDVFVEWGGACLGAPPDACVFTVGRPAAAVVQSGQSDEVTATFGRASPAAGLQPLTVEVPSLDEFTADRVGDVAVTSSPAGIDCGTTCSALFPADSRVTLKKEPNALYLGMAWQGACIGSASLCTVVPDAPTRVFALPLLPPPPPAPACCLGGVGVNVRVSGRGSVTSGSEGLYGDEIDCGKRSATLLDCEGRFRLGTYVTLRAKPAKRFVRWRGFCTGRRPTCSLRVNAPKTVQAMFR